MSGKSRALKVRELNNARAFAVASATVPDLVYVVTTLGAAMHCSCPATGTCKHERAVAKWLELEQERVS